MNSDARTRPIVNRADRIKLVVWISLLVSACHSFSRPGVPTPAEALAGNPKQVRVVLNDGTMMDIVNPSMIGETLVGSAWTGLAGQPIRIAIPAAEIKTVQLPKFSVVKTLGLVSILGVAALVALFYIVVVGDPNY